MRVIVAGAFLIAALALGVVAGNTVLEEDEPDGQAVALEQVSALQEGQYQGICTVVTPPEPDPCDAASGTLRYGFLGALVNVPYHGKWQAANPGEVFRLAAVMAAPKCSTPASPQPQTMRTFYGAALAAAAEAVACARHPEAITWPAKNPPPSAGAADKTPPSAPGPLTVTPGG